MMPRSWFLDRSQTQLIQMQQGRFLRNWRRVNGDETYPRFSGLIKGFREEWDGFLKFTQEESLGQVKVSLCELTYIDHIEPPPSADLGSVFPLLSSREPGFLPSPEVLTWATRYSLPNGRGRLQVKMNPALRARDLKMVFSMDFTVRGVPVGPEPDQVFAWFDLAHEWVNRAFDELTGTHMHDQWGRRT